MMQARDNERLESHLKAVLLGERKFENAAQAVSRMILERGIDKISRAGKTVYDYKFFREGKKHVIGWFDELNHFVNFVKDAAEGGSSKEMALVFIGEPGNGKTFVLEYICSRYREFLMRPENRRYTFQFINLNELKTYGRISVIESQTFEDPVVLAMNFFGSRDEAREYLSRMGFDSQTIERLYSNHRPLGACTEHILNDIRSHCDGDVEKMLGFIRIVPVVIAESSGTVTGKYSARDKITSSATDLLGEEDLSRLLELGGVPHPYKYNVRRGAIARVAGGGIHFSDEIFRNKSDLVQIYLQVIQNRNIELDGLRWPIDTLIVATSNSDVFNEFVNERREAPVKDRCRVCYVAHNTDYKLQQELTRYALGSAKKFSVTGEEMHEDPNLVYALSVVVALTRLPHNNKLSPIETMKLEAGEVAGEKSIKALLEIKDTLNASPDVTKRWGQRGIGHRGLGRTVQIMLDMSETHEGRCLFARDAFKAAEREVLDYNQEAVERDKFMKDLQVARRLYRARIKTSIFNAYRDDPEAIRKVVMSYVNMVIGIDSEHLGPEQIWKYKDSQTGEKKQLKIDAIFIESVESRMGLGTAEARESFRTSIRKIYGQKIATDPNYDFMDNERLVRAVTEVRIESDVAGAASLIGALTNRTNEENVQLYNRMAATMLGKLGYCRTCAEKTIEYFCEKTDEE